MQDVYAGWPRLSKTKDVVKRLRIVQVLPKTTPHSNTPRVGLANASPGKQVLGTVPVESDGSAYFRAPAGIPLSFQALDERGMAIQTMRSLTYLQPGEQASCVGCHAHRNAAPLVGNVTLASRREPSRFTPGPDGSKPFNYAILVQPILDKHCIECHGDKHPDGGIDLTGTPAGQFTRSYNALAPSGVVLRVEGDASGESRAADLSESIRFAGQPADAIAVQGARGRSTERQGIRAFDHLDGHQCPVLRHFRSGRPAAPATRRADCRSEAGIVRKFNSCPAIGVAASSATHLFYFLKISVIDSQPLTQSHADSAPASVGKIFKRVEAALIGCALPLRDTWRWQWQERRQ